MGSRSSGSTKRRVYIVDRDKALCGTLEKTLASLGYDARSGAGAAALAAALSEKNRLAGKRVGLILSGGNIDFDLFRRWVGTAATAAPGRRAVA